MNEFIDFLVRHWQLSAIFAVLLFVYIIFELKQGNNGSKVTPEKAVSMYNHEQAVILDVRTKDAYEQGHIVGAISVPASDLSGKLKKINKYSKKPVIVACALGREAPKVVTDLRAFGFEQVWELSGGMQAWQAAGLPLTNKD